MEYSQEEADQIREKYQKEFAEIDEINRRLIEGEKVNVPYLPSDVRKAYSRYRFIIANIMADEVDNWDIDDCLKNIKNTF